MTRTFFVALAAALSVCIASPAWAQSGGAAGAGGSSSNAGAAPGTGNNAGPPAAAASGAPRTNNAGPNNVANPNPNPPVAGPNQTGAAGQQGVAGQAAPAGQPASRAPQIDLPHYGNSFNSNGVSQTPWFNNPNARRQLQLDERGFNNLNQRYTTAREAYNQAVTGIDAANLTPAQRAARLRELRRNFNTEFGRNLDATFANRNMRQRYDQLNRQFEGAGAFDNPVLQQQLNLNPTQQSQLQQLAQTWNTEMQNFQQMPLQDRAAAAQQFNQLRAQQSRQIASILTPAQQKIWAQQIGTPFNFEMNDFFPADNGTFNAGVPTPAGQTPVTTGFPPNENPQTAPGTNPVQEQPTQDVRPPGSTQSR